MNFLQVSEPEAAALDAQSYASAQAAQRARTSSNALVSQYGPAAADPAMYQTAVAADAARQMTPLDVQAKTTANASAANTLQQTQLTQDRESQLRAAYALKSAINSGVEAGTAWDTIVAPNASAWGIDPAHAAQLRAHLSQGGPAVSSAAVDALINGLTGPAKPDGSGLTYTRDAQGNLQAGGVDTNFVYHPITGVPAGSTMAGSAASMGISGTLKPVFDPKTGSWSQQGTTKAGQFVKVPYEGTPTAGMNAFASAVRAGVAVNNSEYGVDDGTVQAITGAGTPAPSGATRTITQAILWQESRGNPNVRTSVDGGVGIGQITPSFWKTFSRPGENIKNPADNAAVAARGIDYYNTQYHGDAARVATAYFSGPANVAPLGSATPWIKDAHDGNGVHVSQYVPQVLGRMTGGGPAAPSTASGGPVNYDTLPAKGRQIADTQAAAVVQNATHLQGIDTQIARAKQLAQNPAATGLFGQVLSLGGNIAGPAYDLKVALQPLQSAALKGYIQELQSGGKGGTAGLRIKREADAAMSAYGALDSVQGPEALNTALDSLQTHLHNLQALQEQSFKVQWGKDPYAVMGASASGPAATSGLRAKYGM